MEKKVRGKDGQMKQKRVSMDSIAITLEKIEKEYEGRKVIDKLSYSFLAGSKTAITAPSGVGKTTLLRLILGLEKLDQGQIWYEKKLQASVVFQEDRLLDYALSLIHI